MTGRQFCRPVAPPIFTAFSLCRSVAELLVGSRRLPFDPPLPLQIAPSIPGRHLSAIQVAFTFATLRTGAALRKASTKGETDSLGYAPVFGSTGRDRNSQSHTWSNCFLLNGFAK